MFYFLNPQFLIKDGRRYNYYVCECGETVEYENRAMTIDEFCEVINETKKEKT